VLAKRLGRSRADIAHTVRLLDLPDEAIQLIDAGLLTKGHGKALLSEPDHHRRRTLAKRAADAGWSVRTLEAEIARDQNGGRGLSHTPTIAPRRRDSRTRSSKRPAATPEPPHTSAAIKSSSISPPQTSSPSSLTPPARQPEHRCATWHPCQEDSRISVL